MKKIINKLIKNKYFFSFAFLILIMFPTTVYKQSDNHTRLIVTTIGMDYLDGQYEISALAVIPKSSTEVNANLESFSGKGKTISAALEQIAFNTGKEIGLAHCDCIIMSMDVMKSNITQVLDYFIRTANLTNNSSLLATDQKAKDLVDATKNTSTLLDLSLKDIVTFQDQQSVLNNTTIERFYRNYFSKSSTFLLPILSVEKEQAQGSSGGSDSSSQESSSEGQSSSKQNQKIKNDNQIAVLQDGIYQRNLTEDEMFIYGLLNEKNQSSIIEVEGINDQFVTDSLEIFQQVDKVSLPLYSFEDGKPVVTYEIWLNLLMDEISSEKNYAFASIDSLQNFLSDTVKEQIHKQIETKLSNTLDTMKKEKNDVLDLYKKFDAYHHSKFQKFIGSLDNPKDYTDHIDIRINTHLNYVI